MEPIQTIISFQVPKDLAIRTRVLASRRNLSRSELIRQAVERFIVEETKGGGKDERLDGKK